MSTTSGFKMPDELPATVPIFPLTAALLLPRGTLPLNIFEPRYLAMVDDALKDARMIGMIQPRAALSDPDPAESPEGMAPLCDIGCLGRITGFQETCDGRYLITLKGISRFRVTTELDTTTPYRRCAIDTGLFAADLEPCNAADQVDRDHLLETLQTYLDANDMEADWPSVLEASTESLVNALSMMCPYGPREKQALLEADDLKSRADMLIAMTEMVLQSSEAEARGKLQ